MAEQLGHLRGITRMNGLTSRSPPSLQHLPPSAHMKFVGHRLEEDGCC